MSAFALQDGVVYHTYSTCAHGLDALWGMYQWLDRAPYERNEPRSEGDEQLRLTVEGEPVRVSICHCLACQRRTGSVFGVQARFDADQVTIEGASRQYIRVSDEGNAPSSASVRTAARPSSTPRRPRLESWPPR